MDRFDPVDQAEVEDLILSSLEHVRNVPKYQRNLLEKTLGINLAERSLWTCSISREMLPIDKTLNDAMHAYYSNGIAALEINLFILTLQTKLNVSVGDVAAAIARGEWFRPKAATAAGENARWRNRLFLEALFSGKVYKGTASDVQALVPLIAWLISQVWKDREEIRAETQSFLALNRCVLALRNLSLSRRNKLEEFKILQSCHHKLFNQAYKGECRPKHHHRLHLPFQYDRSGLIWSTWGTEQKHKAYKGLIAGLIQQFIGHECFSRCLMPRLLLKHLEELESKPLLVNKQFELDGPCTEQEVEAACGIPNCAVATSCRLHMVDLKAGDYLFWDAFKLGGRCQFFLEEKKTGQLYVFLNPLRLREANESHNLYTVEPHAHFVAWAAMERPTLASWLCEPDEKTVVCMR